MIHPLAAAMARASRGTPNETTATVNRTVNTYTGWTFAEAYGSNSVPSHSRLPCSLNISDLENPALCYWCAGPLPHKKEN